MITREEFKKLTQSYADFERKVEIQKVSLAGLSIDAPDAASMLSQVKEIFKEQQYAVSDMLIKPLVIDAGANIGLASLYFSKAWPQANIYAYEADPYVFGILSENVKRNCVENINLINAAVWSYDGDVEFNATGTDAGHVAEGSGEKVKAIDFNIELARFDTIDLLKMDIEGGENVVFPHIQGHLSRVRNLILEYHSTSGQPQQLGKVLSIIEKSGFRYHIHQINKRNRPLVNRNPKGFFDCQVNIFAYKSE